MLLTLAAPGAQATQGQPVLAGQLNTATGSTHVRTSGAYGLIGETTNQQNGQYGVLGLNNVGGTPATGGVLGVGYIGVSGGPPVPVADGSIGVRGVNNDPDGRAGVMGFSDHGFGVEGESSFNAGVRGKSTDAAGVLAINDAGGLALDVDGKLRLERSGLVTIPSGQKSATIPVANVDANTLAFAMVQNETAGVYVKAVDPDPAADQVKIVLSKAPQAPKTASVAWFLLG